jgi:hypothetical protein
MPFDSFSIPIDRRPTFLYDHFHFLCSARMARRNWLRISPALILALETVSKEHFQLRMFWVILVEMENLAGVKQRFSAVRDLLDERSRRLVVAAESVALGRGGISAASRATGMSRPVIREGIKELKARVRVAPGRVRRPGGGRKRVAERDPSVVSDLEKQRRRQPPRPQRTV